MYIYTVENMMHKKYIVEWRTTKFYREKLWEINEVGKLITLIDKQQFFYLYDGTAEMQLGKKKNVVGTLFLFLYLFLYVCSGFLFSWKLLSSWTFEFVVDS